MFAKQLLGQLTVDKIRFRYLRNIHVHPIKGLKPIQSGGPWRERFPVFSWQPIQQTSLNQ
ncbi:MAG: hypothetical protein O2964_15060 [Verrucomicrobia bacterium]|nr:hypothetical protein [Verrucomicrobiota bacterium]